MLSKNYIKTLRIHKGCVHLVEKFVEVCFALLKLQFAMFFAVKLLGMCNFIEEYFGDIFYRY